MWYNQLNQITELPRGPIPLPNDSWVISESPASSRVSETLHASPVTW